jgi:two-component system cell cycle sensor histidine kinase/response regulator CckA
MATEHVRILLIEDDPADARLIRELLKETREMTFTVDGAETLAAGTARLAADGYDVVMLDLGLPDSVGLETVRRLNAAVKRLPVLIVLSIVADQDLAVQAVQLGAQDYLIKGIVDAGGLVRSIRYARERRRGEEALRKAQAELETRVRERTAELARANAELQAEVVERKQAEEALRASQRLLQGIVDNAAAAIYVKDIDGRYLLVNRGFEDLFHVTRDQIRGQTDAALFAPDRAQAARAHDLRVLEANGPLQWEELHPQEDGMHSYVALKFPLHDSTGRAFATCGISTDITERKRLEAQLMQSQKLESIGRLAGGVAHDFNNILTAILGYGEIVTRELAPDNPLVEDVEEIKLAAERAGRLTRQLLIFARRGVVEPRLLDLSELTVNLAHLLRRLIGEHVELVVHASPKPWPVRADAGQLEQVLVNLAVNARDAMPRGGRLVIETANVEVGAGESGEVHPGLAPGFYLRLVVSDTGSGMSPETRTHLFEPFFTTKGGRGTGLGLATCHGIVQQCGGSIFCNSEEGRGTTFTIYLPRHEGGAHGLDLLEESPVPGGHETVLVVEDDPSVREIAVRALRARGYQVAEAANGVEALAVADRLGNRIDVLVTDMVMPQMGGLDLAEKLRALRPRLRALFTSGYAEDSAVQLRDVGDVRFLQKPFTGSALARRVREVLGQG